MLIIGRKGASRATGLGDLAWGLPSFVTEGLNPLHHLEVMKNVVTHPVDTFKAETGKAVGNFLSVAQPWVGGPGGVKPGQSSFSQTGAALTSSQPCGFVDRLVRFFGGHPGCV